MSTPSLPSGSHIVGDPTHVADHNLLANAAAVAAYTANNGSDFADAGSTRANIHVPALTPAACVASVNVPTRSGPGGATTIASGSNSVALPQATINVASTTTLPLSGTINVVTGAGTQAVTYTGTTSTTFTGCAGGTGTMTTGGAVTATFDAYLLGATDTILLSAQTTASQNGPWLIPAGVSGSWTRPTEFASAAVVKGRTIRILNGTVNANTDWTLIAPTAGITVDTTSQVWTVTQPASAPASTEQAILGNASNKWGVNYVHAPFDPRNAGYGWLTASGADNSSAVAAAALAASNFSGGGEVRFPSGVTVASAIPIYTKVKYQGRGRGATVLQLPASSTNDVMITNGFASLTGTTAGGGPTQFEIRELSVNGNKANAPSGGRGIKIWGYEFTLADLNIYECQSDGLYTDYQDSSGFTYTTGMMDSLVSWVKSFDNNGAGLYNNGAHDSIAINSSFARNGTYQVYAGGAGWNFVNCHNWGFTPYAWYLVGGNQLTSCQGEGATIANFFVDYHDARIIGGLSFFPGTSTAVGLAFGASSPLPMRTVIEGLHIYDFSSASGASVALANCGAQAKLNITIDQASGTAITGTPPADADVHINVGGGLPASAGIIQIPGYVLQTSTPFAPSQYPPAIYDAFVGANASAPNTTPWTKTVGSGTGAAVTIQSNQLQLKGGATGGYSANDHVSLNSTLASTLADTEILFKFIYGTLTVETYFYGAVRASAAFPLAGTAYWIYITMTTSGGSSIALQKAVSGTVTNLYAPSGFGPTLGQAFWFRLRVQGTAITYRTWADGTAEPATPTWSGTDSSATSGLVTLALTSGSAAASGVHQIDNVAIYAL